MSLQTRVSVLVLLFLLTGCATTPLSNNLLESPPANLEAATRLTHVPFFPQDQYQCGPAALATILAASGVDISPRDLVSQVYVPGKTGSYQLELVTASRSHNRLAYLLAPSLEAMLQEVTAGNPVLVLQNLGIRMAPQWHFAVVTGYNLADKTLTLNSGTIENYTMPIKVFERTWARGNHWALLVTAPGQLPATAEPKKLFDALSALEFNNADNALLAAYYQAALARWPDNRTLLMGYGNLMFAMEDLETAAATFASVVARQPDFAPAHNNLAFVQHQLGNHDAALVHASRAVALGGEFAEDYRETYSLIATQSP